MPRSALQQPHHRQPAAPDQAVLAERVHRVLATGRGEPARRQPQRRDHVAVQLDDEDHAARDGWPSRPSSRPAAGHRATLRRASGPAQRRPQFLLQPRRDRVPTARAAPGSPPGRAGSSSSITPRARGAAAGPPGAAARRCQRISRPPVRSWVRRRARRRDAQCVHDEIGLHRPHPLTDRGTEIRRPRHPVPGRKHRAKSCVESRSQRTAALATPARHDRPPGTGAHPQPEAVHPRTTPVVGLKGPLALGHGCHSSLRLASATHAMKLMPVGTQSRLVSSSVSLASRRGPQRLRVAAVSPRSGDCSRVLTRFP